MSTPTTIGMNTSRAQLKIHITAAAASSVSAMLRTLRSTGVVGVSAGDGCAQDVGVRSISHGSGSEDGIHRVARQRLQRFVDGDGGLGALGGRDDHELHVARGVAGDVQPRDAPSSRDDRS